MPGLIGTHLHDLPPRWDGRAVLWEGWSTGLRAQVFICPPPPKSPPCCEGCGSLAEPVVNRGLVALWPSSTHDDLRYEEENRRRLGSFAHKRRARALWRLRAFRCPDCRLDTVWDTDTDEWWTLDDSDYGDDGSVAP